MHDKKKRKKEGKIMKGEKIIKTLEGE